MLHNKSGDAEIMIRKDTDEIIREIFDLLLDRFQAGLEQSMEGTGFVLNIVDELHYNSRTINLKCVGSYTDSSEWVRSKKSYNKQKNNYDNFFWYAIAVALNHENIGKHSERIGKTKPFIGKYNWEEPNFLSDQKTGKNLKQTTRSTSVDLNVLFAPPNKEEEIKKSKFQNKI